MLPDLAHIAFDVPCHRCGYNLRGLLPDCQCPECNQSIVPSLAALCRRLPADDPARSQIPQVLTAIAARDARTTGECLAFATEVLTLALRRTGNAALAQDLWIAAVDIAFASAGRDALPWLATRGIQTSRDLGHLVFALADVYLTTLHSDDRIEDFDALPSAQSLLQRCFPMEHDPVSDAIAIDYRLRCRCLRSLKGLKPGHDCPRCGAPVGRAILRAWKRATTRESRKIHKHEQHLRALLLELQRRAAFRAGMAERAAQIAWVGIYDAQVLRASHLLPLPLSAELIQSCILSAAMFEHGYLAARFLHFLGLQTGPDVARLAAALATVGLGRRHADPARFYRLAPMVTLYEAATDPSNQTKNLLTVARQLAATQV